MIIYSYSQNAYLLTFPPSTRTKLCFRTTKTTTTIWRWPAELLHVNTIRRRCGCNNSWDSHSAPERPGFRPRWYDSKRSDTEGEGGDDWDDCGNESYFFGGWFYSAAPPTSRTAAATAQTTAWPPSRVDPARWRCFSSPICDRWFPESWTRSIILRNEQMQNL